MRLKNVQMEFDATIQGNQYKFYFINPQSVLISGADAEYILYKGKQWQCADEITESLLCSLGQTIDQFLQVRSS